jgi:DNA polymerase elongation subunit (family B)
MHNDVADLDITSSYPTHMIIFNMSVETYWGRIMGFCTNDIQMYKSGKGIHEPLHDGRPIYDLNVKYTRAREFPEFQVLKESGFKTVSGEKLNKFNKLLKVGGLSIAPNGAVFLNKPKGILATVVQQAFNERVKQKGLKSKYKQLSIDDPKNADKWKEMSQNRHVLQWAIKILINSAYGILAVPYCRMFNPHIAEAVTSSARHTIKQGQVFVNDLLNNPNDEVLGILREVGGLIDGTGKN